MNIIPYNPIFSSILQKSHRTQDELPEGLHEPDLLELHHEAGGSDVEKPAAVWRSHQDRKHSNKGMLKNCITTYKDCSIN